MTDAQRLKQVFNIDISICHPCGSRAKVIACSEDPDAISKILTALKNKEAVEEKQKAHTGSLNSRAPPQIYLRRLNLLSPTLQSNNGFLSVEKQTIYHEH